MNLLIIRLAVAARATAGRFAREDGQATVEYALVVLAAATIALLVLAWAASTGKIGQLLDKVIDSISGKVT